MAIYKQSSGIKGDWVKTNELTNGMLIKLVTETKPSQGEYGEQNVAQCKIKGFNDVKNIRINKTSIGGLIQAFGEDSNGWIDKALTVNVEKALVAGKRVTILYLVPEGFELKEDGNGYMVIVPSGTVPTIKQGEEIPVFEEEKDMNLPF